MFETAERHARALQNAERFNEEVVPLIEASGLPAAEGVGCGRLSWRKVRGEEVLHGRICHLAAEVPTVVLAVLVERPGQHIALRGRGVEIWETTTQPGSGDLPNAVRAFAERWREYTAPGAAWS